MNKILLSIVFILLLSFPVYSQTVRGKSGVRGKTRVGPAIQSVNANAGGDRAAIINETLSLDGTASVGAFDGLKPNSGTHSIVWDFGYDGWTYEGGLTAPVAYPEPGNYTVTLTVCDQAGTCDSDTAQVTVTDFPACASETTLTDTGNPATNRTNLQAEIDNNLGVANRCVNLPTSFIWQGEIVLKHRTSPTYHTIRSANHASLPDGATRVDLADATNMPKGEITTTTGEIVGTPTTSTSPARYYRFVGIHFRKSPSTLAYSGSAFVEIGQSGITALNEVPNHIQFDRCIFDGGSTTSNTIRGVFFRALDSAVVNSYLPQFKFAGADSQAILQIIGERNAFMNNYAEAAGENMMTGGADHTLTNHVPTDIVVRRNHFKGDPCWLSTEGCYYGVNYTVKNRFEIKQGQRFSIQGNLFQDHWLEDQNYAIALTPRNQSGGNPWTVVQYIDFSYNKLNRIGNGMSILAQDDLNTSLNSNHVFIRQNIFSGVSFYNGTHNLFIFTKGATNGAADRVYFIHNSSDANGVGGQGRTIDFASSNAHTNCVMVGNSFQGYFTLDSPSSQGEAAWQNACPGSYTVTSNGFYLPTGTNPAGNTTVATRADVLYADIPNFNLALQAGSPFKTVGPGGSDAGADVGTVDTMTRGTVTGDWSGGGGDTTPPMISNVQPSGTLATSTTANVSWSTDDLSDSRVFYDTVSRPSDTDGSLYANSTTLDTNLVTSHSEGLSGLIAGTQYFYKVRSESTGGIAFSSEGNFTTASAPTPLFEDDFDDNSLDAEYTIGSIAFQNLSVTVTETGQELQIQPLSSEPNPAINGVFTNPYDFTGREARVTLKADLSTSAEAWLVVVLDANNYFRLHMVGGGSLFTRSRVAASNSNIDHGAFSFTTHKHFRIRHDPTPDQIVWEYSTNGTDWNELRRIARPLTITSMKVYLSGGTGASVASPNAVRFDDFILQ